MKAAITQRGIEKTNHVLNDPSVGRSYIGEFLGGKILGLSTSFLMDSLIPSTIGATIAPQVLVAASAGGDLATPVAYWFQRELLRVRVGSTNAGGVPATSGLVPTITQNTDARGVLRMALADVNAAAHMLLDQGGLTPIPCGSKSRWDVYFHVANVTNGDMVETDGYAELGVTGGAVGVDPTAVANAAAVLFKIGASKITMLSVATTASTIASAPLPSGEFVLRLSFDNVTREVSGYINHSFLGKYALPSAVTAVEVAGRVAHLAAYAAASDSPLGVDLDSLIVNVPNNLN